MAYDDPYLVEPDGETVTQDDVDSALLTWDEYLDAWCDAVDYQDWSASEDHRRPRLSRRHQLKLEE